MTFVLAAYRGNIRNIGLHKTHIRPLRGGRPRTIVRVAGRDTRAGAEGLGYKTIIHIRVCVCVCAHARPAFCSVFVVTLH